MKKNNNKILFLPKTVALDCGILVKGLLKLFIFGARVN
jgi:hypothetical protein